MFASALKGDVVPSFYIYPVDTGIGKTLLIKSFLAEWKACGFNPAGGVLIAVNSREEIMDLATGSGLSNGDFAIYTSDSDYNGLGIDVNSAPVLFAIHAMLRARLSSKGFPFATEFYYHGRTRNLRIWDERCLRALPIRLSIDSVAHLYEKVRPYYPDWVESLESFFNLVKRTPVGASLTGPRKFGIGQQFVRVEGVAPALTPAEMDIYRQLKTAAGRRLLVCAGKRYGNTLIGSGPPLPSSLAPMFVLDASARIGKAYAL